VALFPALLETRFLMLFPFLACMYRFRFLELISAAFGFRIPAHVFLLDLAEVFFFYALPTTTAAARRFPYFLTRRTGLTPDSAFF